MLKTTADLTAAGLALDFRKLNSQEKLSPHGKRMIEYVMENQKFVDFVKLWRQMFLDTMRPTKLPYDWPQVPQVYLKFGVRRPSHELQDIKQER